MIEVKDFSSFYPYVGLIIVNIIKNLNRNPHSSKTATDLAKKSTKTVHLKQ